MNFHNNKDSQVFVILNAYNPSQKIERAKAMYLVSYIDD